MITDKQKAYLDTVPALSRGIVERAFEGKSRAIAVKAKCLACCNWQRDEVAQCRVETCPLWQFRPFRPLQKASKSRISKLALPHGQVPDEAENIEIRG